MYTVHVKMIIITMPKATHVSQSYLVPRLRWLRSFSQTHSPALPPNITILLSNTAQP